MSISFPRLASGTGLCLFAALVVAASAWAGPVPANKPAHYPDWWFERDVIPRLPAHANTPSTSWPDHYPTADDFAVANIGQLKAIASAAIAEFDVALPNPGAGAALHALLDAWTNPDSQVAQDNFAVLNQGQLKSVAALFYNRLRQVGYFGTPIIKWNLYPWTSSTADDDSFSAVNLGQLKLVFSFIQTASSVVPLPLDPYMADEDLDGIPNGWEIENGLDPFSPADAAHTSGGFTYLELYQQSLGGGVDPTTANVAGLIVFSP